MGILADWQIKEEIQITPFAKGCKRKGRISYGLTSYGYDLRLASTYKVFSNANGASIVDPKNFDENSFISHTGKYCIIPPNSFALAESYEEIKIPRSIQTVCVGKSTYARCGIIVNVTPLEPEWFGRVTIEISNTTPLPVKVYSMEGILQVLFFRTDGRTSALLKSLGLTKKGKTLHGQDRIEEILKLTDCQVSYADKAGKYQDQKGLTLPLVDGVSKKRKRGAA